MKIINHLHRPYLQKTGTIYQRTEKNEHCRDVWCSFRQHSLRILFNQLLFLFFPLHIPLFDALHVILYEKALLH